MSYRILDQDGALEYIRSHPRSSAILDPQADLECAEIGDGNLNMVFRVYEREHPSRSILLKQGVPYLRVAGESWPLSPQRAAIEARALELQHKFAPGLVPMPYWFDEALNVNAMEDLRQHQVLRKPMVARIKYEGLGRTIGEFLAATLFGTSDFGMEAKAKKVLAARFVNGQLCEITEDLILSEPFEPRLLGGKANRNRFNPLVSEDLTALQSDPEIKRNVARLKYRFMTCAQALLHGDLHTGSIMASAPDARGNADIRVIDPEFAFYGPMGFDLGLFVANLFLNAASQEKHTLDPASRAEYRRYLYAQAGECWEALESGFRQRWKGSHDLSWANPGFQDRFLLELLHDAAGYAGCETIRRTVGFAHVWDLESIPGQEDRAEAERLALNLGGELIRGHERFSSFAEIMALVKSIIPA
jgi:5-methylthioribose kinase